jgi:hypothetical protein
MSLFLPHRLTDRPTVSINYYYYYYYAALIILLNKDCTFHCDVLKFYSCFLTAGNSTELVHTEVVVRLCARAGLSEHSVPAATSALRTHWHNATLLNHKSRRFQLNEDFQIELEFIQAGSLHRRERQAA